MKVFSFLALLLIISYCTSKPIKTEQCFIILDQIVQDEEWPPVVIANFNPPDTLIPYRTKVIQVSPTEYERIRRIIKFNSNIRPDTSANTKFHGGSIYVSETCNSKVVYHVTFASPKSNKYLDFVIQFMKYDNTRKEIVDAITYFKY